ncbi:MAG TPA: transcription elongation factor GreA [Chloroflexota bacterium]|nr:transcription elongation factor GreA [Chloroflexota bacterium]
MPVRAVYVTREGFKKFEEELEHLRSVKRPQVAERIRKAKEFTDTVDNAEYDEAKSEQAFVEGRIQEIEGTLANAQIIGEGPHPDYVALGSHVTVKDADGVEEKYKIVGSVEADPRHGLISNESPVGRALLGKRAGERVSVDAPGGSFDLTVVEVA